MNKLLNLSVALVLGTLGLLSGSCQAGDLSKIQNGTYLLNIDHKSMGNDVLFNLAEGGDNIERPRGEFTVLKNDEGYLIDGCMIFYRGAEVKVNGMCGEKDSQIYCRVVPDYIEVQSLEQLATMKEIIEVFLDVADENTLKVKVLDPMSLAGGSVDVFNEYNTYKYSKERQGKSRCVHE